MMRGKKYLRIITVFLIFSITILVVYLYSPYKIEGVGYYDKIWAHRVNSLEKLNSALDYFEGVELDLIYNEKSNVLDVNHTPGESIGLNFETYLNAIPANTYPYLWLDIKTLNRDNADLILKRLVYLFKAKKYPLKNVLVETLQPEALPVFEKQGFKTSYYLPPKLYLKEADDLKNSIAEIKRVIKSQPNISISTGYRNYQIIKTHFPNQNKYIWAINRVVNYAEYTEIRNILKDKTVSIVLLNYKAIKGNR
ncbi:hypothetical protein [Pontimicrobium sp. MEBiC01747]